MDGGGSREVDDDMGWIYSREFGILSGLVDEARESPVPVRRSDVVREDVVKERW
jgi:hypothetical protein